MERKCSICGCSQNEQMMYSFFNGARMMWFCWECYKKSQAEANGSEAFRNGHLSIISKKGVTK